MYLSLVLAVALVDDFHDCCDTDQDVHNPFNHWPRSKQHVHDVEVAPEEAAYADEAPVKSSDKDEE